MGTRDSQGKCLHKNVQQYTECCLDCGQNIYNTPEEAPKTSKESCPHKNVQQYTECCLDCGKNIYTGK